MDNSTRSSASHDGGAVFDDVASEKSTATKDSEYPFDLNNGRIQDDMKSPLVPVRNLKSRDLDRRTSGLNLEDLRTPRGGRVGDSEKTPSERLLDGLKSPAIPGTRRLNSRVNSGLASTSIHNAEGGAYQTTDYIHHASILALKPTMSPSPRYRSIAATKQRGKSFKDPTGNWESDAFRIKRREAQMALELLPRYTAAFRAVKTNEEFETIMSNSINSHLDDEYEEAINEIIKNRQLGRAFLCWKSAARSILKQQARRGAKPMASFAVLDMMYSKVPRIPTRIEARRSTTPLNRPRVDSSATTDAGTAGMELEDRTEVNKPSTEILEDEPSEEDANAAMIKQVYFDSAVAEMKRTNSSYKLKRERGRSSRRLGTVVNAFMRIASFRSKAKN